MFDPTLPQENTPLDAVQMRSQFTGLKTLLDAMQSLNAAQIVAVTTLPPGDPANVTVSVTGSTLHFTFDIPQGEAGTTGSDGAPGANGADGATGAPGEVTLAQLDSAIDTTSSNSNGVATLGLAVSDPPTQSEVQQLADKLDELILSLRR